MTRRVPRIVAVALCAATATCVDHPTAPRDVEVTRVPLAPAAATSIVHTLLTAGGTAVNGKVCTTASIAPAANALVTVAVLGHNGSAASPSPVVSGGGMAAWAQVATVTFDPVGTPHKRMSVFRAMSASPGSGPIRITFTATQANCEWVVSQWQGVETSGSNGSNAIAQSGSSRANTVTGLTVTLGAFSSSNNVAYGIFGIRRSAAGITPGTGFTEIAERASGETPPSDLQAEQRPGDNTVDAKWIKLNAGALALEIKAAGAGATAVASVDVTPDSTGILVGDSVRLAAAPKGPGGEPLTGRTVTWTTSNAQVATVSSSGLVTGVAAGTATITATSEGKSGSARVTVATTASPVASVQVSPASSTIASGVTVQLTGTPKDAAGQPLSSRTVAWSTSAPAVATVSSSGLVAGVAAGSATITAMSEGKQGTATITVTALSGPAAVGQWSSVMPSPIVQLHLHLLDDGRLLSWGLVGGPQLWDPATGNFTATPPSPTLLFCSGHTFLPDGRLLVAGGHISNDHGLPATNIFDPVTSTWQAGASMAQGRWYPTTTTLSDGEVLVLSGEDENGAVAAVPEVWNGTGWRQLTTASLSLPNYPRTFVAPDGRVFYAGSQQQSRWLNVSGTGKWTLGPSMHFGPRTYGAAVMYAPGKILYAGGGSPPVNTAEIIDLNQSSPSWTQTGSLAYARWNLNATVLPTGDVLVTGGTSLSDRSDPAGKVNVAELWSPTSNAWTQLASSAPLLRGYHSTTLLLPDGRVFHSGGGDGASAPNNLNYEIYSPPYLFQGPRPTITGGVPSDAGYGQTLTVTTPDGAGITKVTLIHLGSVTHAFDQAQRLVPLPFSQVSGGLSVTLPPSGNKAPPGPYMIFLVNGNGVPSVAKILRLQ
ncbi:MAG: Ig-like domain-containing protein [Gemmatimonadales bacterium]